MNNKMVQTEAELVKRCKGGDSSAFSELMRQYNSRLFSYLYRQVPDREYAKDLFQDTFLRVWQQRKKLDPQRAFAPWLFAIASNLVVDARRRQETRQRHNGTSASVQVESEDPVSEELLANELAQKLQESVQELPDRQKQVFLLRMESGLKFKEIAIALELPLNTVLSQMQYAIKKLKNKIGSEYAEKK